MPNGCLIVTASRPVSVILKEQCVNLMSMTSQKPYLIRAIHEWLLDNQCTPYVLVNTRHEGVQVPLDFVKDNRIVLNIAPDAIRNLQMDNEWISFSARFAGKAMDVFIPISSVQDRKSTR